MYGRERVGRDLRGWDVVCNVARVEGSRSFVTTNDGPSVDRANLNGCKDFPK